jgi:hypothetical protein
MREWRYSTTILDLGSRWSEWSASLPGGFTPTERPAVSRYEAAGVGLNAVEKRIITEFFVGNRTPAVQFVACRYTN